jgi:DNA polymerase (family 10)
MELKRAETIARGVVEKLAPHCERYQIEIAGSIRRKKSFVHDIDIVCIPGNQGAFITALQSLGKIKMGGQKLIRVTMPEIELDIYIATLDTWATLLLIRTGSKEHNIRMCIRARSRGMTLKADGSGLFKIAPNQTEYENAPDVRIAGDTEESIFKALELPYLEPEKRV